MKQIYLIMLLIFAVCVPGFAQEKKKSKAEMRKELQEYKLKFIAQEIDLQEEQQKKFFEYYNQMDDERVKVFKETRSLEKKLKDSENATDEEYEKVSKALTEAKEKDAAIVKRYDEKFATFLSAKQIFKMKAAEETFWQKMREMRHKSRKMNK